MNVGMTINRCLLGGVPKMCFSNEKALTYLDDYFVTCDKSCVKML
jgi:hypothetical protein